MLKLLLAESSDIFIDSLKNMLISTYEIQVCRDGFQVRSDLERFCPDVFVLNLMMPHVDGLSILQQTTHHPKVIVALTTYTSPYIEHRLRSVGVDYIMVAPSPRALRDRLLDVSHNQPSPTVPVETADSISACLQQLGMPAHLDGYRHLCVSIPLYAEDPTQLITKELYPTIARSCGCKDARTVEHSIRSAIQYAWTRKNNHIWQKYFPTDASGHIPCPTNKEFISKLSEHFSR